MWISDSSGYLVNVAFPEIRQCHVCKSVIKTLLSHADVKNTTVHKDVCPKCGYVLGESNMYIFNNQVVTR